MIYNIPGLTRVSVDPIDISDNHRQKQQEQPQPQQAQLARGSECARLQSRLALTSRYSLYPHPTSNIAPSLERIRRYEVAASLNETWQGPQDYRRDPPRPLLLSTTVTLMELSFTVKPLSGKRSLGHSALPALLQVLDSEAAELKTVLMAQEVPEALKRLGLRMLLHRFKMIRQLAERLTTQSASSGELGRAASAARERHMQEDAQDKSLLSTNKRRTVLDRAVSDAAALVDSSDFEPLRFGEVVQGGGGGSAEQQAERRLDREEQQECHTHLLWIRLLLASEPFFVSCSGAAHMCAFFELAKSRSLYMQLLPTQAHANSIFELLDARQESPTGLTSMLMEVSCNPTSEHQYEMYCILSTGYCIPAATVHQSHLLALAEIISGRRKQGEAFIVNCNALDLSKLMLALYKELLTSHKPLNITALHNKFEDRKRTIPIYPTVMRALAESVAAPSSSLTADREQLALMIM